MRANAATLNGQAQQNATRAGRKAAPKPAAAAQQAPGAGASAGATNPTPGRKPMPDFGDYFKDEPAAKAAPTGSRMESKPRPAPEPVGSRVGAKAAAQPKTGKGKVGLIGAAVGSAGTALGMSAYQKNKEDQYKAAHETVLSDMEKFASRMY